MRKDFSNLAAMAFTCGVCVLGSGALNADTAYVANEQTVTIAVIDTSSSTITTTIGLGSDPAIPGTPQPNGPFNGEPQHHNPFYNGHVDPHGLWLTPDGKVLLVANRISGTIVAVDTVTNSVLGYAPVGREPHLATVRPGGREAWVALRGESHIDVLSLDPNVLFNPAVRRSDRLPRIASNDSALGLSMVSFTSDGQFAFVAAGRDRESTKSTPTRVRSWRARP
jgi:YVTN family beta-propeller protein